MHISCLAATMEAAVLPCRSSSLRWQSRQACRRFALHRISILIRKAWHPSQPADNLLSQAPEDAPHILLGAEVLICDGMERLGGLDELCLEGTNELLLEMPFYRWTDQVWDTLYCLNDLREIQIVIAHADRYPPENIRQLISEGIPLQLNVECLCKPLHRKRYLEWIKNGCVYYLGSDIHEYGTGYRDFEKCRKLLSR